MSGVDKCTRGEWQAVPDPHRELGQGDVERYRLQSGMIPVIDGYVLRREDAHMLAASKDMYAALKGMLASHRPGRGQCCEAADAAIDALARAEGK
jgi:hypothetical protein